MKTLFTRLCFGLIALVGLSGCKYTNTPKRANEIMVSGWVGPGTRPSNTKPTYCYSTLGTVECYDEPQPGKAHRLVGFYDPRGVQAVHPLPKESDQSKPQPNPRPASPGRVKKSVKRPAKPMTCHCVPKKSKKRRFNPHKSFS